MSVPPTVSLVCESDSFCRSLQTLISSIGLRFAHFSKGSDYIRQFDASQPGCIIMDLEQSSTEGLTAIEELTKYQLYPPIIVISGQLDVEAVVRAARLGVLTFLPKRHTTQTEIQDAIQVAIAGDARQRAEFARRSEISSRFAALTVAEKAVLKQLLSGDELQDIADQLKVSRRTVENRRARLMEKLRVATLTELVDLTMKYRELTEEDFGS